MSTFSQIARAAAAAAAGAVINPSGPAAGVDDRATRLAATEAAVAEAVETARQAAAALALRAEMEWKTADGW
jgi:tRNA G18 (ribose-2'-O)-methylase SpoU